MDQCELSQEVVEQAMRDAIAVDDARAKVVVLESQVMQLPQVDIPVKHYFSRGVYAREMSAPAGSVIVGRIHKHSQINILSKGEVSVLTDDGVIRVAAPYTFVAQPGAKRAFFIHEDAVWTTICGTESTDVENIADELTVNSYDEFKALSAPQNEKGN
jgi:quercetin dioxygenase-like cupin family protein